jgi:hypothetical protein
VPKAIMTSERLHLQSLWSVQAVSSGLSSLCCLLMVAVISLVYVSPFLDLNLSGGSVTVA